MNLTEAKKVITEYLIEAYKRPWKNYVTHSPRQNSYVLAIVDDKPIIGKVLSEEELEHGQVYRIKKLGFNEEVYINPFEVYDVIII